MRFLFVEENQQGFTIAEIIVVIVLLGIVTAIVFPIVQNIFGVAKSDADAATLANIQKFRDDWTAAGYDLITHNGVLYAVEPGSVSIVGAISQIGGISVNNNNQKNDNEASVESLLAAVNAKWDTSGKPTK